MTDIMDHCPCGGKNLVRHCTKQACTWMICHDCSTIIDPPTGKFAKPIASS
jgi:hypothetical protein